MGLVQQFVEYAKSNAGELGWRAIAALVILLVAWLVSRIARAATARVFTRGTFPPQAKTVLPMLQTMISITALGMGGVLSLEQLGFDLTAVVAGAGVVGLAVAFGSQELVRDVVSGFFLILGDVFRTGDWISTGGVSGTVVGTGLRITQVRSFDGKLWSLPNGQIKVVANSSREWMRAMVTVGLAYEQDARRGMELMAEVGRVWQEEHAGTALEQPTVQGLLSLDASSVGVRLIVKVKAGTHSGAERELRKRIKEAFDREGVEIPFDRQVLYLRKDKDETGAGETIAQGA